MPTVEGLTEEYRPLMVAEREEGWFEQGFERALWHHSCTPFDAAFVIVDDLSRVDLGDHVPDDYEIVTMSESGEILLEDFEHPERAAYLFGRSGRPDFTLPGEKHVRIETPVGVSLFGHVAAVLVMTDRLAKADE